MEGPDKIRGGWKSIEKLISGGTFNSNLRVRGMRAFEVISSSSVLKIEKCIGKQETSAVCRSPPNI